MATVTKTVTLIPYDNTGITNFTTSTSYPVDRGYNDTSNTSFARFSPSNGQTGYIYYKFDTSSIPASATITSVTAKARAYVNNTSRVTNTVCQLCTGTTTRGTNSTFNSTQSSNIVTLSTGTGWTRAYLNDLRIKIGGTGASSSSRYVYFAGAEVTITYTVTVYTVTASGDGTLDPASSTELASGESYTLRISGLSSKPTVTDNNVNVTSQLTESTEATEVLIPESSTVTTFTTSTISNAYTDADSSTYADLQLAGSSTGTVYLDLSGISIPSGATITDVTCKATLQFNNNGSTSGFTSSCQMYANNTAKGSATSWVSSGSAVAKNTYTLTAGSWTASEIANARFYLTATNSARSTARHVYIYGVSFSVTYESDGVTYIYTISSVTANHTITVVANTPSTPPVITVGTPNVTTISAITGHDQCVCTFSSDLALSQWEARATKAGTTPARGVGLLVESGGALAANTNATIYVENEELTNGDGIYTITVYGQSTGGVWSE